MPNDYNQADQTMNEDFQAPAQAVQEYYEERKRLAAEKEARLKQQEEDLAL